MKRLILSVLSLMVLVLSASAQQALTADRVIAYYYGTAANFDDTNWAFAFMSGDNQLLLADVFNVGDATHIDGNYTTANGSISLENTAVVLNGTAISITAGTLTIHHNTATNYHFTLSYETTIGTYTLNQDLDVQAFDFAYKYYCENLGEFCHKTQIRLEDEPFALTGQVVEAELNMDVRVEDTYFESDTLLYFFAHDDEWGYGIDLGLFVQPELSGTYTEVNTNTDYTMFYRYQRDAEGELILDEYEDPIPEYIPIRSMNLTVVYEGDFGTISGTIIGQDGVQYNISILFRYQIFSLTGDTINVVIEQGQVNDWNFSWLGDLIFSGYNGDSTIYVQFDISFAGNRIAGTYTENRAYLNNEHSSFLRINGEKVAFHQVTVTIEHNNPNGVLTAVIVGRDGNIYNVTMPFVFDNGTTAGTEYTINFGEASVNDTGFERWHDLVFTATAEDGSEIALDVIFPNSELNGSFTEVNTFVTLCYIKVNGEELKISSADFTIVYNDPIGTLTGDFTVTNGDVYHITFTFHYGDGEEPVNGLENVNTRKATKRIVNGQLIIEKDGLLYNALGTVL